MTAKIIHGFVSTNPVPVFQMWGSWLKSAGYVQVSLSGTAAGVGSVPDTTVGTLIIIENGDVRYRDDGTNPTASSGMLLKMGGALKYDGDPAALKFINTSSPAKLNITFYAVGGTDA